MDQHELHVDSFEYVWEISPSIIRNSMNNYDVYNSPLFPMDFPSGSGQQWVVQVSRRSYNSNASLQIFPQQENFVCGKFSFTYNNVNLGCIYYNKNGTCDPQEVSMEPIYSAINWNNMDCPIVEIICRASVIVESSIGVSVDAQASKSLLKMREDLETLYDSKQGSDITFSVKDKDIKAHKAILIARSDVFKAMFENQLEECQSGKISITDTDEEVIEEMLYYMYTGKVPKLDTMAAELLECAEKYQLDDLKEICLKSLQTNITTDNVVAILILADTYRSEELKRHAIAYIITNAEDVTETQPWKDLITTHGYLIEEAFRTIAVGTPAKNSKINVLTNTSN